MPSVRHAVPGALLLLRRQANDLNGDDDGRGADPNSPGYSTALFVVPAVVFSAFVLLAVGYLLYKKRGPPRGQYTRTGGDVHDHEMVGGAVAGSSMPATNGAVTTATTTGTPAATGAVDRNPSVRSVITLPPYRPNPLDNEHVLGREGERGGIDVIVEMHTAEDDEALREEEMDTLYQIRVARRRQEEERQARRTARHDARARNDQATLRTIREQSRSSSTNNTQEIEQLRNEHSRVKETRQRAVSSVNYGELGIARLDGTRIRANSSESERVGLLSDAASIGISGAAGAAAAATAGVVASSRPGLHQRGRSASSVVSINTTQSGDDQQLPQPPPPAAQRTRSRESSTMRAGSSPELIDATDADADLTDDAADGRLPRHSPPSYDEVSLQDLTPAPSRSGSPYAEPPPDYTLVATTTASTTSGAPSSAPADEPEGPTEARNRRLSAHISGLAAEASAADAVSGTSGGTHDGSLVGQEGQEGQNGPRSSRQGGIPQLPSLRLAHLPQIVIEPSSATPREGER